MKIADRQTSRAIDKAAMERYSIPGRDLMEKAGMGAARVALGELGAGQLAVIFTGKGNNGGDGFVVARCLREAGAEALVFSLCAVDDLKGDAASAAAAWTSIGGHVEEVLSADALKAVAGDVRRAGVVVDAIFGTGLSTAPEGAHLEAIRLINAEARKVVSIDMPSGVDATTGAVIGEAVRADVTATMALPKLGLCLFPGREYAGRVEVIDIGVPVEAMEDPSIRWNLLTDADISSVLRPRRREAHKASHGHLLVLAGSPGMTGAAYMAATAAMRAGAGLVTLGVPESLHQIMEIKTTEVMTAALPETSGRTLGRVSFDRVRGLLAGKDAVVIGPGAGCSDELMGLIGLMLHEVRVPVVIDADGLNSFVQRIGALKELKAEAVITPHPGEAARLLSVKTADVQADRVGAAERLVETTGATVVLKGAATVVAGPSGQVFINPTGNPGLATAGTGDILAGVVGALLAQGYAAPPAATAAVYIHGLAADEAASGAGEIGMMATDLLAHIPRLMNSFARAAER